MKTQNYLIIGNGVAGTTAAENIRLNDPAGPITIVTDEDLPFYYRIRLPDYLAGVIPQSALVAKKPEWYAEKKITLKLAVKVTDVDGDARLVRTADGATLAYDTLLLANGSHPFVPPLKGADLPGVFTMHTVEDVRRIAQAAREISSVVFIGGGLLGLEAANALHKLGKNITVVEFIPRLLPRQLDDEGGARLKQFFENMDFRFRLGAATREIGGTGRVTKVVLESDEILPADMVILSAGVRPNLDLARKLGLEINRGIMVDKYLQTSRPAVYAAGDVIEFKGICYGIWPAALEQGKIAGRNMAGEDVSYNGTTPSNILKVAGIDLASAGVIDAADRYESKVVVSAGTYKKVVIDNNRVIGCIMLGDRKNFNRILQAIDTGENISGELESLLNP